MTAVCKHACAYLGPQKLVYGQTTAGSDQPTVSELSLNQIITVYTVDEQSWIVTDLLQ